MTCLHNAVVAWVSFIPFRFELTVNQYIFQSDLCFVTLGGRLIFSEKHFSAEKAQCCIFHVRQSVSHENK